MGGPCPGPSVSRDSSGQRQPLGQMVSSQVLATVHQMHPRALSCLAMAPSIMSQWNQRKLAPNYRLLSVKNGIGSGELCHHVEAAWLTHRGTEAHRPHSSHRECVRNSWRGSHTHTHKRKGRPPSLLVGLRPTMRTPQQNPLVFHL